MSRLLIGLIHIYRWIVSPLLPPRCKFDPTCSRYAIHALETHGFMVGVWLIAKRLLRCHPYEKISKQFGAPFGYDPVPSRLHYRAKKKPGNQNNKKKQARFKA